MSAKLVARRTAYKNILNRTLAFSNAIPVEYTPRELKVKLEELEKNYSSCFEVHLQLMELTGAEGAEFEEIEFDAIQSSFERAKSRLIDRIDALVEDVDSEREEEAAVATVVARSEIKLPFLKIAPFSGDYYAWKTFRDLFSSGIGDRRDLSGAQKLHYLKSFLEGEAAQLVRPYCVSDGNYRIAWAALDTRYNNKRLLVNAHFKRLFGQPSVSGEWAHELRQLLDTTAECVAALKEHDLPTEEWDAVLVYITVQRLDAESHKQWEISLDDNELSTFDQLARFMEKRCRSLEAIAGSSSTTSKPNTAQNARSSSARTTSSRTTSVNHVTANPFTSCVVCEQQHFVANCDRFLAMNVAERREVVQQRRLCFVCLRVGHVSAACIKDLCPICSGRHHELLHNRSTAAGSSTAAVLSAVAVSSVATAAAKTAESMAESTAVATAEPTAIQVNSSLSTTRNSAADSVQTHLVLGDRNIQVLLATAWITVNDSEERIRVLVDLGSHVSLMRESCVQRLSLPRKRISVPIRGIGGNPAGTATSMVNVKVKSCVDSSMIFDVAALVLRSLTGQLPNVRVNVSNRPKFVGLQLADPTYYEPGDVDMVLGADVYGSLLLDGVIAGSLEPGRERPSAQNTALGWLLSGPIATSPIVTVERDTNISSLHLGVEWDLRKFWQVEEVGAANLLTDAEKSCEDHFLTTHGRDGTGRYTVRLPFATAPETALGDSRGAALRRLRHIQRRLNDQPDLLAQYDQFMNEYAALGHMRKADRPASGVAYYLPHHFVVKETSSTTRLRVVFDGSCKTSSGRSLNDVQLIGPRLQDDLAALVMRFRRHKVALTADITKMYRQICVHEDDRDYQRILWRGETDAEVQEWQLTTVTYGMAASPFLAVRALQQLAKDEQQSFPRAARVVLSDFYVDDLITGCDSSEDAVGLQRELADLLSRGGFELRKWSSNCEQTLNAIPQELRASCQPLHLNEDVPVRTLGLLWHPAGDWFTFQVAESACGDRVTKRAILSVVARLFDPLGLLAPTVVVAKIIIQRLWTSGLDWDDEVTEPVLSTWLQYHRSLKSLENLQFRRWIGAQHGTKLQFHGFADASETAYGGVVYVRCQRPDGRVQVSLLTAKTKVAPLQQVTLPRLELCAAALLAKLFKNVMATFGLDVVDYTLWSDSQVALGWMRKEPRHWKTFVGNRVAAIQAITTPDRWKYVCSADNPADCLSRGVMPNELITHELWMNGPKWLAAEQATWPVIEVHTETDLDERPAATSVLVSQVDGSEAETLIMHRWSSLLQLRYTTALICRFAYNCRVHAENRRYGHVTASELHDALMLWIRRVQAAGFADEIRCCQRGNDLPSSSKLISLNPFIDQQGILRVGGRLRHATISRHAAHPAILPSDDHLTALIIDDAHKTLMHGGAQLMLAHIRQRFWIIGAKRRLRQYVHSCLVCYRQRPRCAVQQMGDLPKTRVTPGRAFLRSGVDYAGPMAYVSRAGRGSRTEKGYVALFVCLSTKAVHLEFVSDLSSDAFSAAFRRFVARRGRCAELLSDNATNFVGAKRIHNEIVHSRKHSEEVARLLASDGTEWRTIPPRSPHFGGIWEAGVRAVKHHLKRIVGAQLLTFEEFSTVLAQIEAVLNSRPLCALSDDPDDLDALTPGHFLIGCAPTVVPDRNFEDVPTNRLTRWQLTSQITQHFWRRWQREYLTTLQQRYKWATAADNVRVGQLVLLKDELLPPAKWKMARVTGTKPGDDGRVRVVELKHATGETTRAVTRICVLPIDID